MKQELWRRVEELFHAALERQTPNIRPAANLHHGEPFEPLWAKKLLVEGTARHRLGRRKIEFARDAAPHENRK